MPRFYHRPQRKKLARPKARQLRKGRQSSFQALAASPFPASHSDAEKRGKRRSRSVGYFKLIVVFTPCEMVLSSNQRAVTVLVCV